LASVVVPQMMGRTADSRRKATIAEIAILKTTLSTFMIDNGRMPTTAEGLEALVECPADLTETWKGPYIERVPNDKWDHPYHYVSPSVEPKRQYDLFSLGEDGIEGTADDITTTTLR
jgi:general secretion pathway protein G